jgi:hypothetical protein
MTTANTVLIDYSIFLWVRFQFSASHHRRLVDEGMMMLIVNYSSSIAWSAVRQSMLIHNYSARPWPGLVDQMDTVHSRAKSSRILQWYSYVSVSVI